MAEKKTTAKKVVAKSTTTAKKAPVAAKKATVKKVELYINAESAGFRAGDVYQALAAAGKALTVAEIAKAAKISKDEALIGIGWLFKEGKVRGEETLVALA